MAIDFARTMMPSPAGMFWGPGAMGTPGFGFWGNPWSPWGFGPWGGTYPSPAFYPPALPIGYVPGFVPSDDQIKQMVFEAIDADPAVPYGLDVNVDVIGGVVTLSGTVPSKMVKHAVGDDAWLLPGVIDVNNNLQITGRRARPAEEKAGGRPGGQAPSRQTRQR